MDHSLPKPNRQILEEASTWFVELSEDGMSASAREEFTAWLRTSPEHVRAFLQISSIWEDAPLLGNRSIPELEALLARVRFADNVIPLDASAPEASARGVQGPSNQRVRRYVGWGTAAAILLAALGAGFYIQRQRGVYSTGVGETRWVYLADGSTIELNAESRIRIRFSQTERNVDLLEGQALFRVVKNPYRPFIVHSGAAQIMDVGTEFDVYRRQADTLVTVIEGRVAVRATPALGPAQAPLVTNPPPVSGIVSEFRSGENSLVITAGEQVDLTPRTPVRPVSADVAAATAWTRQTLVFASAPLSEVVEQYNLYHEKRLVIKDPMLASYHVSGVFSATDNTALVAFLREQPALSIRETDDEIDISGR
jgi:transmembrane sensor